MPKNVKDFRYYMQCYFFHLTPKAGGEHLHLWLIEEASLSGSMMALSKSGILLRGQVTPDGLILIPIARFDVG